MKLANFLINYFISRGLIKRGSRGPQLSTPLIDYQISDHEHPSHRLLYERLRSQLLLGVTDELIGLSPDSHGSRLFNLKFSLLKLSALMQSGDVAEAKVLSREILSAGGEKEELARFMTSAMIFSQASLSFNLGDEDKAAQQYCEGLKILQMGVDESLIAQAWLGRQRQSRYSSRLHGVRI